MRRATAWIERAELAACAFGTISFAGVEQAGGRWCDQVWYCEAHSLPGPLSLQLLQNAADMNHDPS